VERIKRRKNRLILVEGFQKAHGEKSNTEEIDKSN
jgi:hypothetical protein